jgi:putative nucleotidyltransferase with HDIG domain
MITHADIEALFRPFLARIGNADLRGKVVETWVRGCKAGGWESVADLEQMPFTLVTDARGVSFVEHTLAVTEGAIALYEAQRAHYRHLPFAVDMDYLVAGGLLHDVGKLLEVERFTRPEGDNGYRTSRSGRFARHPVSGAVLAGQVGLDDDVQHMIACHAKEGEGRPQRVETVLIHQADFATFNPLVLLNKGELLT